MRMSLIFIYFGAEHSLSLRSQSNTGHGYVEYPAGLRGGEGDDIAECTKGLGHPLTPRVARPRLCSFLVPTEVSMVFLM